MFMVLPLTYPWRHKVLYIIANLAPVPTDGVPGLHLVDHLNVALAQLTASSIHAYPPFPPR